MRSSVLPLSHTTNRLEVATLLRLGRILNFVKSLSAIGLPLPAPAPYPAGTALDTADRRNAGIQLLRWFLGDGKIRGATPDGIIYEHRSSTRLTAGFIAGLQAEAV